MREKAYLKDIGSGQGFVLPSKIFFYSGRRSYLHQEDAQHHRLPTIEPPRDFMSKKQIRRLHKIEENRAKVLTNHRLRHIRWMGSQMERLDFPQRPSTSGDVQITKKGIYQSEKMAYGYARKGRAGSRVDLGGFDAMEGEAAFNRADWELQFQAGCWFYYNVLNGECLEALPTMEASGQLSGPPRPSTAPACLQVIPARQGIVSSGNQQQGYAEAMPKVGSPSKQVVMDGEVQGVGALVYDPTEVRALLDLLDGKRDTV